MPTDPKSTRLLQTITVGAAIALLGCAQTGDPMGAMDDTADAADAGSDDAESDGASADDDGGGDTGGDTGDADDWWEPAGDDGSEDDGFEDDGFEDDGSEDGGSEDDGSDDGPVVEGATTEMLAVDTGEVILDVRVTTMDGDMPEHTLVLLHGGPGQSDESMHPLEASVMPGWRVVSFDQRGCGDSTSVNNGVELTDLADDVEALRAHFGVDTLHLFGHGFGGLVAWLYLDAHPDSVASVAMFAALAPTFASASQAHEVHSARIVELQGAGLIPDPLPPGENGDCSARLHASFPAYANDPEAETPAAFIATTCSVSTQGLNSLMMEFPTEYDLTAATHAFEGPVVIWAGENDPVGLILADATLPDLPNAQLQHTVIPDAAHFPWLEGYDMAADLQTWMVSVQ